MIEADPPESGDVPRGVVPDQNVTGPVGAGTADTTGIDAVHVTEPPTIGAEGAPDTDSAVSARPGVTLSTGEVLDDHPGVPVNRAVSECTVRSNLWLQVACPEPSTGAVPSAVVPSKNVTEPTGTTDADVPTTVAPRVAVPAAVNGTGTGYSRLVAELARSSGAVSAATLRPVEVEPAA